MVRDVKTCYRLCTILRLARIPSEKSTSNLPLNQSNISSLKIEPWRLETPKRGQAIKETRIVPTWRAKTYPHATICPCKHRHILVIAAMPGKRSESEEPLLNGSHNKKQSQSLYGTTHKDTPSQPATTEIEYLLDDALYPEDTYDEKVYWADLPGKQKWLFNRFQYKTEVRREVEEIKEMARQTWLGPITYYMRNYAISGVGFLTEGYVLFSIGNILPLFKSTYPECWKQYSICDERVIKAIKYMEIVGVSMLASNKNIR